MEGTWKKLSKSSNLLLLVLVDFRGSGTFSVGEAGCLGCCNQIIDLDYLIDSSTNRSQALQDVMQLHEVSPTTRSSLFQPPLLWNFGYD